MGRVQRLCVSKAETLSQRDVEMKTMVVVVGRVSVENYQLHAVPRRLLLRDCCKLVPLS
jgi:hypothetical protein